MKSIKSLLKVSCIIFTLLILVSCSKNEGMDNGTEMIISKLSYATQQAISAPNIIALKQSVSLLSMDERQALWELKFNTILRNDAAKLTTGQKNIILLIRSFLKSKTIKGLIENPEESELFMSRNLSDFMKHFDNAQLYMLIECPYFFDQISIFKSINYLTKLDPHIANANFTGPIIDDGEGNISKCTCLYDWYCYISGGVCRTKNITCDRTNTECGVFGTTPCKGRCG